MSTLIEQAHAREWFYSYELPDGSSTSTYHDADIHAIHDTRWQMLGLLYHLENPVRALRVCRRAHV